ncbi:hypothetical protein [Halobacteriaceae bacterium SHR40]|uniref:hypothetical protein n=1 Tax=Halovenus amylolytica TaxID=2500550 RepID=UPI000FE2B54E
MTRQAVTDGFEQFVGDAIEQTAAEFSLSRVIGGSQGGMIDRLLESSENLQETLVEPKLAEHRQEIITQFDVILDYAESDSPIDEYRTAILDADSFADSLRPDLPDDRRQTVLDELLERHRKLGDAVEPVLLAEESDFWVAARNALTEAEAKQLVEEHFAFTGPLRDHRSAFAMETTIDPAEVLGGLGGMFGGSEIEIEYTDEALRAMRHAEREVIADATSNVEAQFE